MRLTHDKKPTPQLLPCRKYQKVFLTLFGLRFWEIAGEEKVAREVAERHTERTLETEMHG
jgi:hypothetical protein